MNDQSAIAANAVPSARVIFEDMRAIKVECSRRSKPFYYNFVILPVKQPCDPRSTSSAFDLDTDGPILQVLAQCTLNQIRCLLDTVASQRV
jgi:hypothetical protein